MPPARIKPLAGSKSAGGDRPSKQRPYHSSGGTTHSTGPLFFTSALDTALSLLVSTLIDPPTIHSQARGLCPKGRPSSWEIEGP